IGGEDVIEALEIGGIGLPAAQRGKIVAAFGRMFDGAGIGRRADVIAVGAGGIDVDLAGQRAVRDHFAEHALGGGRAADIAHADEQHADVHAASPSGVSLPPRVSILVRSIRNSSRSLAAFSNSRLRAASIISRSTRLIADSICFSFMTSYFLRSCAALRLLLRSSRLSSIS